LIGFNPKDFQQMKISQDFGLKLKITVQIFEEICKTFRHPITLLVFEVFWLQIRRRRLGLRRAYSTHSQISLIFIPIPKSNIFKLTKQDESVSLDFNNHSLSTFWDDFEGNL
jgi:hypothetical protein